METARSTLLWPWSACLSEDFVRELKTSPGFWFGPELIRRIMRGNSPVLSDREVRVANSGNGLNEPGNVLSQLILCSS